MVKNSQLHLALETDLFEDLQKQAKDSGLTLSEFCRQKLVECSQLTRIESSLKRLEEKILKRGLKNDSP